MIGFGMANIKRKAILAGMMILGLALSGCSYSDGSRAGVVSKFSHKGFVCKSWEGELVMGGMRNQLDQSNINTSVPNVFQFSVTDPKIVPLIQGKLDSGERAVLHYNQEILPPFCNRKTAYVIKDVK